MTIDKKFLMNLMKSDRDNNLYLFNLYRNYELCSKMTNGDIRRKVHLLNQCEDRVYTIDGKILSEQDRIILEIKRIYRACSNIKNENIKKNFIDQLVKIVGYINKNSKSETNQAEFYLTAKKALSVIQSKLGLTIRFFYAAALAFIDKYQSEYLNSQQYIGDIFDYCEEVIFDDIDDTKRNGGE